MFSSITMSSDRGDKGKGFLNVYCNQHLLFHVHLQTKSCIYIMHIELHVDTTLRHIEARQFYGRNHQRLQDFWLDWLASIYHPEKTPAYFLVAWYPLHLNLTHRRLCVRLTPVWASRQEELLTPLPGITVLTICFIGPVIGHVRNQ